MVCIYCGGKTAVTNSRLQTKANSVWRRRRCYACKAVFTTEEHASYESSFAMQYNASHIVPFERDMLFLSIYEACRHRKNAVSDAASLTTTVLSKLQMIATSNGAIQRNDIVRVTSETLKLFDNASAVHYLAYHPLHD